jgi:hypothetical protein
LDFSGLKDLGQKRLNEKARVVLLALSKKFGKPSIADFE